MEMSGVAGMSTVLAIRGRFSFSSNSNTGAGYRRRGLRLCLRLLALGVEGGKRDGGFGGLDIVLSLFV
jgi:hypothetical protein